MRLTEAQLWRDRLRFVGTEATVPLGHAPDGYFVKVWPPELYGSARLLERARDCEIILKSINITRAFASLMQNPIQQSPVENIGTDD